jgi:hypothetical protein
MTARKTGSHSGAATDRTAETAVLTPALAIEIASLRIGEGPQMSGDVRRCPEMSGDVRVGFWRLRREVA